MARIESFEKYSKEYDKWFVRNKTVYLAELNAIKSLIPSGKTGVEIGVGSGRFALPLGIKVGVEPSKKMAEMARNLGIQVYEAVAEKLPFDSETFDFALMVTTICFVDNLVEAFKEVHRVLKPDGLIIVGFVDKNSEMGTQYQLKRDNSKFYKDATFYSVEEVTDCLRKAHFEVISIKQTVFPSPSNKIDSVKEGHGEGSFVVIKANKTS